MRHQRRLQRTFLTALALAALSAPAAVRAADCPAGDYSALVACAAAATAGDTITLSATFNAAITPTLDVPANVELINNGFMLNGAIVKTGAGTLTLNGPNAPTLIVINAGTIAINQNDSLGGGAIQMNGGRLLSNSNLAISPVGFTFVSGTSTVAAVAGGQLGISGPMTLNAATNAVFGFSPNTGSVFLGISSATVDASALVTISGAQVIAASPAASQVMAQASSVTINSGGMRSNGGPLTIGNLQGSSPLTSVTMSGPSPQPLTIMSGSYAGTIGGNAILTKDGPGTFVMSGLPSWTAGTNIIQGTLQLGNINAITLGGSITINGTLAINSANTYRLTGSINGGGGITKSGTGALILSPPGSNTYSGTTRINGGIFAFLDASSLGNPGSVIEMNGGTLQYANVGSTTLAKPFSMIGGINRICTASGAELTVTGGFAGTSSETHFGGACGGAGTGTVTFTGHVSFDPGPLFIDSGTVNISGAFDGNVFRLAQPTTINGAGSLRADVVTPLRIFDLQGNGQVVIAQGELQIDQGNFDGVISGPGGLRQLGSVPGTTLTGNNTYSGTTTVQGKLTVGNGGSSGSTGTGNIVQLGQLLFNRVDAFEIANTLDGNGSIEFNGGGTFTLSGTGSNSGNFRTAGPATLVVTGNFPSARPQLNNIGVLRGTGTVQGFQGLAGSTFEPGVGGGTGTFNAGLPSWVGLTTRFKLNGPTAGSQYDQMRMSGFASFNATLAVTMGFTPAPGTTFVIVDNTGVGAISGTFTGLAEGAVFTAGATMLRISYAGGTGNDIVLTAVSVPGAPTIGTAVLQSPTSIQVTFTPPASDGASPILDYTAQCGATTVSGAGSPLVVTGLPPGPTTCTVRARNAIGNSPLSASLPVTAGQFSFSGPSATGSGTITVMVSGGGGGCSFVTQPVFVPLSAVPDTPPANTDFPHGLAGIVAEFCTPGSTATFTIVYPAPLPAGTRYWVYGPTAATPANHWYMLTPAQAVIAGDTITITLTDDADGDALLTPGTIAFGGGPGVPIAVPPASTPPPVSLGNAYQALWWAGSAESGWGVNTTQQGNILFVTWFTYGADGQGQWFLMSNAQQTAPGVFTGTIYTTRGPAFNSVPFDSRQVVTTEVGMGTLTFTSPTTGQFDYTVNGITQSKPLSRFQFGDVVPECTVGGEPGTIVNYQDTWWNPSESGWGLTIAHQGDVMFVTWFTYDASGKAQWLLMSNVRRVGLSDQFKGSIYRNSGNPFNSQPWSTSSIHVTEVGTVTLTFVGRDSGTFAYTLDGVSQVKSIQRTEFASPKAMCRFP